ncbi:aldo/keto reductase [Alloscardovia criceti]|uniref:aldo/keto reductase n=1 Tax=Alloscardovia criceti TaxID=356828 RepID=UPI0003772BDB|nr:aldo/keto reductase [Alloscardovia criceti]
MKYAQLGHTDINVSRICVGGMSFGQRFEDFHAWTLDQGATTAVIRQALDLGVNFIDTANVYSHGTSEEFIGSALKNLGVKREDVVLATKVYFNEGKLSKQAIEREIDGSLKRLGVDYVDLYQIHRFDYDTPIEETMEALDGLVKAGKVRALGASAMYGYQFHNMQIAAEKNGWTLFSTMQNHYNLLYREDERELIPVCQQYGVSLVPYSPLAGGHLTRPTWHDEHSLRDQTDKVSRQKYDAARENDEAIIARVHEIAERYGVSMAQVSLAWLAAQGVTAPIVGATSAKHFEDAVHYVDLELSADDVRYLSEPYAAHEIVGALSAQ